MVVRPFEKFPGYSLQRHLSTGRWLTGKMRPGLRPHRPGGRDQVALLKATSGMQGNPLSPPPSK